MDKNIKFNLKGYKYKYYKYYKFKKKWLMNDANIWFNKTCLQRKLIPQYAKTKNKSYNYVSKLSNDQYSKLRIKMKINFYTKRRTF